MKRMITLLLCLSLLICSIPAGVLSVSAEEDGNLAIGKTASALSMREGFKMDAAIDGDTKTYWASTGGTYGTWYMVDLEESYVITSVVLHNRTDDTTPHYRRNVNIEFSNTPDFSVKEVVQAMGQKETPLGEPVEVKPTTKTPYRYVRAVKAHTDTMVINELEIYGYLPGDGGLQIGTDVVGTDLEGPVSLLAFLGLMGLEDEINEVFGVDTLLTRGEAAEAVVDAFGGDVAFVGGVPFDDVDASHPNYQAITTAYYLSYVTGDSHEAFRPDAYVTQKEFLLMTLRAMGYADIIDSTYQNNLSKVLALTEELDLLKNVSVTSYDGLVRRKDAARIFYQALLAPGVDLYSMEHGHLIYDEGADLLRKNHNMVLTQGVVNENRISTIDGEAKSGKDAAKIGNEKFYDPDGLLDTYLGKQVVIATLTDSANKVLLAWTTGRDTEVVLSANVLCSTKADVQSGVIVSQTEKGNTERHQLEDDFYVIKNGVADPYYSVEDLMLSNGQLRLLDNDRDGVYEVVFIDAFSLHYVMNAFYDANELTIIDKAGVRKSLDRETITITDAAGEKVAIKQITADKLVKLFAPSDGKHAHIVVYDKPIEGTLTMLSGEMAGVNNVNYPLSLAYRKVLRSYEPVPGENVAIFVDEVGEILWIENDTEAELSEWTIAYSQKVGIGSGLSPDVTFRFFTETGSWVTARVADRLVLDGKSVEKQMLINDIKTKSAGRFTEELLRYKLNAEGNISALDTLTADAVANSTGLSFALGAKVDTALYTKNSGAFWLKQEMLMPAKNTTPVFMIPTIDGKFTKDSSYDGFYKISTVSSVAGENQHKAQDLQSYMQDERKYPACFIKTQNYAAGSGQQFNVVGTEQAPYLLVEKTTNVVTEEGNVAIKITGRSITNSGLGAETSFLAETTLEFVESGLLYQEQPACLYTNNLINMTEVEKLSNKSRYIKPVTNIGFGDIVCYQTGLATVQAVERVFDYNKSAKPVKSETADGATWYISGGNNTDFYIGYHRYQLGSLSQVYKDAFTLKTLAGHDETYQKTLIGKYVYCNLDGRVPALSDNAEIGNFQGDSVMVMVFSYNGSPRLAVIYPY